MKLIVVTLAGREKYLRLLSHEAIRSGRLDDFRVPDREVRLSRFSINALGFFGSEKIALGDQFCPEGNRAEAEWLSAVLPAKLDRPGKILGDLLVTHFSLYTQERRLLQTGILDEYYAVAGVPVPAYDKPVDRMRWKDRLRPWRRRKVATEFENKGSSAGRRRVWQSCFVIRSMTMHRGSFQPVPNGSGWTQPGKGLRIVACR